VKMETVADAMEWVWTGGNWEAMPFIATWSVDIPFGSAVFVFINAGELHLHVILLRGKLYAGKRQNAQSQTQMTTSTTQTSKRDLHICRRIDAFAMCV